MTWKARVFWWGNPVHHLLHAETHIPSFAWAGDRVSTQAAPPRSPRSDTSQHLHAQAAADARRLRSWGCEHAHVSLRESSKPRNPGSGCGDACPGTAAYLVFLPSEWSRSAAVTVVTVSDYTGNKCKWPHAIGMSWTGRSATKRWSTKLLDQYAESFSFSSNALNSRNNFRFFLPRFCTWFLPSTGKQTTKNLVNLLLTKCLARCLLPTICYAYS